MQTARAIASGRTATLDRQFAESAKRTFQNRDEAGILAPAEGHRNTAIGRLQ